MHLTEQISSKNYEVEEVKMINWKQGKLYNVIHLKAYHNRKHIMYFGVWSLKYINPQLCNSYILLEFHEFCMMVPG